MKVQLVADQVLHFELDFSVNNIFFKVQNTTRATNAFYAKLIFLMST